MRSRLTEIIGYNRRGRICGKRKSPHLGKGNPVLAAGPSNKKNGPG